MKQIITFILILITSLSSAQKKYKFDYAIETEITFYKEDSIKKQVIYLTNSKDNSYFVELTSNDSLYHKMVFKHHNKLYSSGLISKPKLNNAESVLLSCSTIFFKKFKSKYGTKAYDYILLKDTIINSISHKAYKLKSTLSLRKRKRKGAGTNLYIIDNSTSFHLPFLKNLTAYEEWELQKNLPNGLFIEEKHINFEEEEHSSEKLIRYVKIDKEIVIPDECYSSK